MDRNELIKIGMAGAPVDQKIGKYAVGAVLIGALLFALKYALPWIMPVFTSIEQIADSLLRTGVYVLIGAAIFVFLKAQWKNIVLLNDSIARKTLSSIINYDPWVAQYKQIDVAEQNWNKTLSEKEKIAAKYSELNGKVNKSQQERLIAIEAEKIAKQDLLRKDLTPEGRTMKEQIVQDQAQLQIDNQNYITTVGPLVRDMKVILDIVSNGQIVMKHKIERMRRSLTQLKDTYESAKAGANALIAMRKALTGGNELNDIAEQSKLKVLQDIAMSIGQMTTSMEIISEITTSSNLQDAAKMAVAKKQLSELGITDGSIPIDSYQTTNFNQIATISDTRFSLPD